LLTPEYDTMSANTRVITRYAVFIKTTSSSLLVWVTYRSLMK
jgi:hypothetical protein